MSDFAADFGLSLHDAGRSAARVSFSRVLLPHIGRVDADAFCSTVNLRAEREYAVTFDFDRAALRQLLALLPSAAGAGLGAKLSTPFEDPEIVEFDIPIIVAVDATVAAPIENAEERYAPLRVRRFRVADAVTRVEIEDAPAPPKDRRRPKKK